MKKIIAFGSVFMPFIVSAQTSFGQAPGSNLDSFILWIKAAMNMATTLILGAAIVYLIWNVFGFVMADLTHHHDVRILTKRRAQRSEAVSSMALSVSLSWYQSGDWSISLPLRLALSTLSSQRRCR